MPSLFLARTALLGANAFGSLAIRSKHYCAFGWILPGYFLLYKCNKQTIRDDGANYLEPVTTSLASPSGQQQANTSGS